MRVYISGKMGGRTGHEVLQERQEVMNICAEYDIEPVDPAANENIRDSQCLIDLSMDYITMKSFVAKDEFAIGTCEAMLVITGDTPSDGTWWEMGLAKFELNIPVIMIAPRRASGGLMGFSNIKVDAIFSTAREAIEFLAENYKEI